MREVTTVGPTPPEGQQFCVMCAIRYKQEILELPEYEAEVQARMREDGPRVFLDMEQYNNGRVGQPEASVGLGVCAPLGNTLVPLCWGHLPAIKFTSVMPG